MGSESGRKSKGTESSEFAGLLFLVPILERLGFAEMLVAQPALIECDFPVRLLLFIGGRVGLRPGDPLAAVLDVFDPATPLPETWEMPEAARRELARAQAAKASGFAIARVVDRDPPLVPASRGDGSYLPDLPARRCRRFANASRYFVCSGRGRYSAAPPRARRRSGLGAVAGPGHSIPLP